MSSARSVIVTAAILLVAAPIAAQKPATSPVTPAPIKKTTIAPAAPVAALPRTIHTPGISFTGIKPSSAAITTARITFVGLPAGGVAITTAQITFAGPLPGGAVIATPTITFVGNAAAAKGSINTATITFVGVRAPVSFTIATDPISFVGIRP